MGYNLSINSIDRVSSYLDEMITASSDLTWHTPDPAKTAYYIRQGIAAAQALGDDKYAQLNSKFLIRSRSGIVVAELRNRTTESLLTEQLAKIVINDVNDLPSLIGAVIQHKGYEMVFPNFIQPDDAQLETIYNWINMENLSYHIINSEHGLVVTKKEVRDIAWHPPLGKESS
jgi:hypothetical protein